MDARAQSLLAAYDTGAQIPLLSKDATLSTTRAYEISAEIWQARLARGERTVGRKIGFTNRTIWPIYGVEAPIWSWMYDTTVAPLPGNGCVVLPNLAEPRLEPEIAFHFHTAPEPGMAIADIAACIDWMAHGFEIVTSVFSSWKFTLADTIAAQSLHGCYWYGPAVDLPDIAALEDFSITLTGPGQSLQGRGADVLGGPLHALKFLENEISRMPGAPPIQPGEIVTTGTLTDACPVAPGETWSTEIKGIGVGGQSVRFTQG